MHAPLGVREALRQGQQRLAATSPTAALDAAILLGWLLGLERAQLYASDQQLAPSEASRFDALLERRQRGEPIAYIVGYRDFYGLRLSVDRRVLMPRPDTEILVEAALEWIAAQQRPLRIADIGTGSGAIIAALASQAPQHRYWAVDISADALAVAQHNLAQLGLAERVTTLLGDGITALSEPLDLIVSNPPYTILTEIDPEVHAFEPHLALDGGPDGLEIYRRWLPEFAATLRRDQPAAIMVEIGAWQGADVLALARAALPEASVSLRQDLAGRDRVVSVEHTPARPQ